MATAPKKIDRAWVPKRAAFERDDKQDAFYNSWPWRKCRKAFKIKNILCVHCLAQDITTPMKVVDHIIPIKAGGLPLDHSNLQSLCEKCHNKKSGTESRGYGVKSQSF